MNNDKKCIPVFIHHETGEKSQIGKDQRQLYLMLCIRQAEKSGNDVILFGDNGNKDWCNNWINVKDVHLQKWNQFLVAFENLSTYPDAWAKGIFHRFFIFEQYIKEKNINSFFVLDSDILLYADLSQFDIWNGVDFAASIPESNQLGNEIVNNLRWTINAGVSYWTKNSIINFTDFCIDTYTNRKEILKKKWYFHQIHHYPGGICEMSLLYLWVKANPMMKVLNLVNTGILGIVFNSDINGKEGYFKDEFKLITSLGIKKIYFINEMPYLIKKDGSHVIVQNLHFVGVAKLLMEDIYVYKRVRGKTYFYYTLLNTKMRIGRLYRNIKRKI